MLAKEGIANTAFSGELNDKERVAAVADCHEGRKPVLLVSGAAGSQGTRSIHVLNRH